MEGDELHHFSVWKKNKERKEGLQALTEAADPAAQTCRFPPTYTQVQLESINKSLRDLSVERQLQRSKGMSCDYERVTYSSHQKSIILKFMEHFHPEDKTKRLAAKYLKGIEGYERITSSILRKWIIRDEYERFVSLTSASKEIREHVVLSGAEVPVLAKQAILKSSVENKSSPLSSSGRGLSLTISGCSGASVTAVHSLLEDKTQDSRAELMIPAELVPQLRYSLQTRPVTSNSILTTILLHARPVDYEIAFDYLHSFCDDDTKIFDLFSTKDARVQMWQQLLNDGLLAHHGQHAPFV